MVGVLAKVHTGHLLNTCLTRYWLGQFTVRDLNFFVVSNESGRVVAQVGFLTYQVACIRILRPFIIVGFSRMLHTSPSYVQDGTKGTWHSMLNDRKAVHTIVSSCDNMERRQNVAKVRKELKCVKIEGRHLNISNNQ